MLFTINPEKHPLLPTKPKEKVVSYMYLPTKQVASAYLTLEDLYLHYIQQSAQ
jgi:hypothetical protein